MLYIPNLTLNDSVVELTYTPVCLPTRYTNAATYDSESPLGPRLTYVDSSGVIVTPPMIIKNGVITFEVPQGTRLEELQLS